MTALRGIDLDIEQNEFVTLLGPSGCGKTTLLRVIAGLERLNAGTLHLDGVDIHDLPPFKRPVNTVFQSYALFPHMTVARNVGYSLEVRGTDLATRERLIRDALALVGLEGMGNRKPAQLSGGQRQRVALARATIAQPRILLLDEPLSALDRQLRQQMQSELKSLQHKLGITFVLVTHDQEEALAMSDRIVVMRNGNIEQVAPPRELFRRPANRFVAEFIGETNLIPVRIQQDPQGWCAISPNGLSFRLPDSAGYKTNQTADLILRPADFTLSTVRDKYSMPVTILEKTYQGADLSYRVAPNTGDAPLKISTRDDGEPYPVGSTAMLNYDPKAIHLLESV